MQTRTLPVNSRRRLARVSKRIQAVLLRWTIARLDTQLAVLQASMAAELTRLTVLDFYSDHSRELDQAYDKDRRLSAQLATRRAMAEAKLMLLTRWPA